MSVTPRKLFDVAEERRRIWFQVPPLTQAPRDGLVTQRVMSRPIVLLRPHTDAVVLPTEQPIREFFDFCVENLNLDQSQAIFVNNVKDVEDVSSEVRDWILDDDRSTTNQQSILLPYTDAKTVSKLDDKLADVASRAYIDDLTAKPHLGHRVMLTRMDPKRPDTLSWIEAHPVPGIDSVKTVVGYLCNDVGDLLRAARILSDQGFTSVVLKPMSGGDGRGVLTVANKPQNLRFYDFANGQISVEGTLKLDLDVDGLVKNFTVVSHSDAMLGYVEQLLLGGRCVGFKYVPPTSLNEEQQMLVAWSQATLTSMEVSGPTTLEFLFEGGVPCCADANPGRFGLEHLALVFYNTLAAPTLRFLCLVSTPPADLDIWTLWSRLFDHDSATFNPKRATDGGIFPLLYLRGVNATFMILAETDEEIQRLRSVLEECLSEPVATKTLNPGDVFDESMRRIWCCGPRPESTLQGQRYNLPYRFLSIVRPDKDLIILPQGLKVGDEAMQFCKTVVGLKDSQVIYTKGESFCMDDDMDDEVIGKLKSIITSSPNDKFMFVPYTGCKEFYNWADQFQELDVAVFADSSDWLAQYGHKGILHRHIQSLDQPSVLELVDPKIRVAKGYTCDTVSDLLKAYELIGAKNVIIKPNLGSAGSGIIFVTDKTQLELYDFPNGSVILEETLEIDVYADGNALSPAHHYCKSQLIGLDVDQIMVGTKYMGWKESTCSTAFKKAALRYTDKLVEYIKPMGPGGFDYLSVGGKPVLSDINTGRFNGSHQPKLFIENYAKGCKWICWKHKPPANLSIMAFWKKLEQKGIAFTPGKSKTGVYPLLYLRGRSGIFIGISEDAAEQQRFWNESVQMFQDSIAEMDVDEDVEAIETNKLVSCKRFLGEKDTRIWIQLPTQKLSADHTARLRMMCRPIALLRVGVDAVVLPDDQTVREYFDFCCENRGLLPWQAIYPADHSLTCVREAVQTWLGEHKSSDRIVLIPRTDPHSILEMGKDLEGVDTRVYTDDVTTKPHLEHRAILVRTEPTTPSWIESHPVADFDDVKTVTGYQCTTSEELLAISPILKQQGFANIVLKPIHVSDGRGVIFVANNPHNLRFYDFSHGPISVEGRLRLDLDVDGLVKNFTVVTLGNHTLFMYVEQLILGQRCVGFKYLPEASLTDEQKRLALWSRTTITNMAPTGPVTLEFLFQDGVAHCADANPGRFSLEHVALMYYKSLNAPTLGFLCLTVSPPETLDIWTLWSRLFDHDNVTFEEDKAENGGIKSLEYFRGASATFLIFGKTEEEIQRLRTVLEECLSEPVTTKSLEQGQIFDESVRRIFCCSPRPESIVAAQRHNLPYRFVSFARPQKDLVVLPAGLKVGVEFVEFCQEVIGLDESQIIYTKGEHFCMDEDMDDEVIGKLKSIITSAADDKFMFVPYTGCKEFYNWADQFQELDVAVFADSSDWLAKFGHKGILHRHIQSLDQPSVLELIDPKIRVAKGYACDTVSDLLKAYELIGAKSVVIKPNLGSAGSGIVFVTDKTQLELYDFPDGAVILEETLVIDVALDGNAVSPAHHYCKSQLIGMDVDQIMVGTKYMGWKESTCSTAFKKAALRYTDKMVNYMQPMGPGGFDYLSVGGKPVLSDVNTGRFNGSHQPKLFVEAHAKGSKWICWKHTPPRSLDVNTFWRRLQERGIAFTPGETAEGVFPLLYLRGQTGVFIAISKNEKQLTNYQARATQLLMQSKKKKAGPKRIGQFEQLRSTADQDDAETVDMMLIKNAVIYSPDLIEPRNVVVAGGKIIGLLSDTAAEPIEAMLVASGGHVIDAKGDFVVPGLVDIHLHLCGGGGEMGFESQTEQAKLHELFNAGLTTVIGVLGTDSITKGPATLLSKVEGLNSEGISAYMYTGSYRVPCPTITGSVMNDVAFIRPVVGVGEIAISDHRSSHASFDSIVQLASESRIGGMLGGKAGVTYFHVGNGGARINTLEELLKSSEVPISNLLPTHMSRDQNLFNMGIQWVKKGGYIDLTARDRGTFKMLAEAVQASKVEGADDPTVVNRIICSSDAYGSLPKFDEDGELKSYATADPEALLRYIKVMYFEHMWSLEDALRPITSNPAKFMKFKHKGCIQVGNDADLLILQRHNLSLKYVVSQGEVVKTPTYTKRSRFAPPPPQAQPAANPPPTELTELTHH